MSKLNDHDVNPRYRLATIEATSPPDGMPEGDWYQYIVEYGKSKMNCVRSGTLEEVTRHAEEFVENLNTRTAVGYSSYAQRKVKK